MPRTLLGKWSVGFIVAFLVFLGLSRFTGEVGATFSDNVPRALTILSAWVTAAASFFVGLVAVIKQRERSALVFLAMLIGLVILGFALGDILGLEQ